MQEIQKNNDCPHLLSRGGYELLEKKLLDEKMKKRQHDALLTENPALKDSTIYTPSLQDVNLPLKATNFEDHTQTQLFNPPPLSSCYCPLLPTQMYDMGHEDEEEDDDNNNTTTNNNDDDKNIIAELTTIK